MTSFCAVHTGTGCPSQFLKLWEDVPTVIRSTWLLEYPLLSVLVFPSRLPQSTSILSQINLKIVNEDLSVIPNSIQPLSGLSLKLLTAGEKAYFFFTF